MTEHDQILKDNFVRLIEDHREHCETDCDISFTLALEVLERAGIEVNPDERSWFL